MSERPRRKNGGLESKAYYIVLLLCLAAIGVCGYFLTQGLLAARTGGFGQDPAAAVSGQAALEDQREAIRRADEKLKAQAKAKEAAEKAREKEAAEKTAQPEAKEPETPAAPAQETAVYVWPVEGAVDRPFSLEVFAYDPTMGDWRTHDGLDIAADGTYSMSVTVPMDESASEQTTGTWEVTADGIAMTDGDTGLTDMASLQADGTLAFESEGVRLVFATADAVASGAFAPSASADTVTYVKNPKVSSE